MRFLSTSPHEFGVISVGQIAFGFLAFGQVAVGVVALGQVSFSIVGVGQVGAGVAWFAGMLGLGGRGFCLRLIPGLDVPRLAPPEVTLDAVWQGGARGFVRVGMTGTPQGPALVANGQVLPVKLRPTVAWALENALKTSPIREVYASLRREGTVVVCDRVVEVPGQRKSSMPLWVNVARVLALIALATFWCYVFSEVGPKG